jgi:hypothetical protein
MQVLKRASKAGPLDRAILSHWATELPCFSYNSSKDRDRTKSLSRNVKIVVVLSVLCTKKMLLALNGFEVSEIRDLGTIIV